MDTVMETGSHFYNIKAVQNVSHAHTGHMYVREHTHAHRHAYTHIDII